MFSLNAIVHDVGLGDRLSQDHVKGTLVTLSGSKVSCHPEGGGCCLLTSKAAVLEV